MTDLEFLEKTCLGVFEPEGAKMRFFKVYDESTHGVFSNFSHSRLSFNRLKIDLNIFLGKILC